MEKKDYKYLLKVDSPTDLKRLTEKELPCYCDELRDFIVSHLAENPGHLGSSLGVVELTTALHYVYDTPHDRIIWDVGHQAYAHKIITGRRDVFHTNRKLNGISGFPKMSESQYDPFGGGHSSVSISAAFGMASANKLLGEDRDTVAVIGDGALTGGLAFEGLNNAGAADTDLLVILNDNNMSIDPNVGALKEYLLSITTSTRYNRFKFKAGRTLRKWPWLFNVVDRGMGALKLGLLQQSNLFESLNFRYFGPVDGHDVKQLTKVIRDLKKIKGPKLLHVLTVKGKGYRPAEANQTEWHAPGRYDPETGVRINTADSSLPPRWQDVFGETLLELARENEKIVGITPAMPKGCSLNIMMKEFPDRCFDVGIAEGHAVTFSAGLAAAGMVPFCNIYSSFMQRAYDNVIHDVALQNLGVVFCLDRAGIVGEDGSTHQGVFDISYFRPVPNLVISSPMDQNDLRNLMYTAQRSGVPFIIRYPRGRVFQRMEPAPFSAIEIGKARMLREGNDTAVLSFGPTGVSSREAIEKAGENGLSVAHVDLRFAKPMDEELLREVGGKFREIITVEDGTIAGGVGSAVIEFFEREGIECGVRRLGVPDRFIQHGKPDELISLCGYDTDSIYRTILSVCGK